MSRPTAILLSCVMGLAMAPAIAVAHGGDDDAYRTTIVEVEPAGLPVDVRMTDGDEIRFENAGDEELVLCGYDTDACEEWVRIGPDGVFVDEQSKAFYSNADADEIGTVPEGAGEGEPEWTRVRKAPPFYTYHDHRVHWMGRALPPSVDERDPSVQKVMDGEVEFRYGDTAGVVRTRLDYVGGQTWMDEYLEQLLVAAGIVVMALWFVVDAVRRRRRRAAVGAAAGEAGRPGAVDVAADRADEGGTQRPADDDAVGAGSGRSDA